MLTGISRENQKISAKLVSRKDFYERYLQHALSEPYTTYLNEGRLFNV